MSRIRRERSADEMRNGDPFTMVDPARTGIFISVFNRPEYTRRSLDSLLRHPPHKGSRIFIVDDASTDFGRPAFEALQRLKEAFPGTAVFKNHRNIGISRMVRKFVDMAALFKVDHLYITDNDMIYGREWFENLVRCYTHFARHHARVIVSCLNVPHHLALERATNNAVVVEKAGIGGASWFTSLATMQELLPRDVENDWDDMCIERIRTSGGIIGCTRRSFVQHIGAYGLNSKGVFDQGVDFVGWTRAAGQHDIDSARTSHRTSVAPNLIIGIPSVRRDTDYLHQTVASLLQKTTAEEKELFKIVIFNGEVPPAQHLQVHDLRTRYRNLFETGCIEVFANEEVYPEVKRGNLVKRNHDDPPFRITWRSKQVLDVASLMERCRDQGEYYLHLEDDVIASTSFVSKILRWISERPRLGQKFIDRSDWLMLSFFTPYPSVTDGQEYDPKSFYGFIGQLFRTEDLDGIVRYFRANFDEKPVDWLIGDYVAKQGRKIYVRVPSLFQHIGVVSSLMGKTQPMTAPEFEP